MRLPVRPLPLAAALLLALPVALGAQPAAAAAPQADQECKPAKRCVVEEPAPSGAAAPPPAARVVVADVDSGINPYHEAFRGSNVTPEVLAELGIGESQIIDLTSIKKVKQDFAGVQPGTPYWFRGTNVIGISFEPKSDKNVPIFGDDGDEHGTGTAAAVLGANPEAVVVMVEGTAVADAEKWAFTHPAVDIVTTSYGFPGSPPVPFHLENSYEGTVKRGKLHFGAADNSPALSPPDGTSGPWWSIGVGGFHEDTSNGRELLSGNAVDVVSDFTQDLPYCSDCTTGTETVSGTSFATPRSAGTASKILLEARRKAGHVGGPVVKDGTGSLIVSGSMNLTPWQLRRAFEEAASYATGPYNAQAAVLKDFGSSVPVSPVAPYVQTGWGIFSPDAKYGVVTEALAQLGVTGTPRAPKGADACAFNNANIDLRHAYWDSVAIGSESFLTADDDPYLYC